MAITVQLAIVLAKRKMTLSELANKIDFDTERLAMLVYGDAIGIRWKTLDLICDALDCQPGDLIEFVRKKEPIKRSQDRD